MKTCKNENCNRPIAVDVGCPWCDSCETRDIFSETNHAMCETCLACDGAARYGRYLCDHCEGDFRKFWQLPGESVEVPRYHAGSHPAHKPPSHKSLERLEVFLNHLEGTLDE